MKQWRALSSKKRENIAFKATGCEVAFPSWEPPVDCVHIGCMIRRGEKKPIDLTKAVLDGERAGGWLRFLSDEEYGKLYKAFLKLAKKTKVYDPWKIPGGWRVIVGAGIGF